jgi:alkanesulfonate monooxygenase SsuD/methylene tetrahydromethanopterin reductase-like flavin-dependent oxidoreductase (luciferase family)
VWGSPDDVAEQIDGFSAAGVDAAILLPAAGEPDLASFYGSAGEVARLVE